MGFDLSILIAIGALVVSAASYFSKTLDKSLSIREHDEFRKAVDGRFNDLVDQSRREIDQIQTRLHDLEKLKLPK
jgi:hypothetical protein